jgi:hypothetical protein
MNSRNKWQSDSTEGITYANDCVKYGNDIADFSTGSQEILVNLKTFTGPNLKWVLFW